VNWTGVPLQTGALEDQLQSGPEVTVISLVHSLEQPLSAVTLTLSVAVPCEPAAKVIDWVSLAEVISPLVMDQAYAAPAAAVEAALPVDPAQTESGADMVQSGPEVTVISLAHSFMQPPSVVTMTLSVAVPCETAAKVIDWVLLAEVIVPFVIDQAYAAPAAAVEAALPVDPAQTESGAVMVQSGIGLISIVPEQDVDPQLLATVRLTE
jgi:hypothetical protein